MSENYATEQFLDSYKPLIMERLRYSGTPDSDFKKRMEDAVRFLFKHKVLTGTLEPHPILVAVAYIFAKRFEARALLYRGVITRAQYDHSLTDDIIQGAQESARWMVRRGWWMPIRSYGRRQLYFSTRRVEKSLRDFCMENYHHFESGI